MHRVHLAAGHRARPATRIQADSWSSPRRCPAGRAAVWRHRHHPETRPHVPLRPGV